MDVALAGQSFEGPNSGQVCDTLLSGSSGVEAVRLSVASEASLEKHFEDGARYDELPRSAASNDLGCTAWLSRTSCTPNPSLTPPV